MVLVYYYLLLQQHLSLRSALGGLDIVRRWRVALMIRPFSTLSASAAMFLLGLRPAVFQGWSESVKALLVKDPASILSLR